MSTEIPDGEQEHEHTNPVRSYVALGFAAILVFVLVWIVNAIKESNRIVACETSGHHNCVPLDTSARGSSR
jgi:hypothetical protein